MMKSQSDLNLMDVRSHTVSGGPLPFSRLSLLLSNLAISSPETPVMGKTQGSPFLPLPSPSICIFHPEMNHLQLFQAVAFVTFYANKDEPALCHK